MTKKIAFLLVFVWRPVTFREEFESAMQVNTKAEAAVWLYERAAQLIRTEKLFGPEVPGVPLNTELAVALIRTNLGYMAGYYGQEAQIKALDYYGALHPVVESMTAEQRRGRNFAFQFSAEELMEAGRNWARCSRVKGKKE